MIVPGPDNLIFRLMRAITYGWLAVLVLGLDPRTEDPAAPIKVLATAIAAVVLCGMWAVGLWRNRVPYRPMKLPLSALPFFFVLFLPSALAGGTPLQSLAALAPWALYAVIGLLAYQCFPHTHHLRNLIRAVVVAIAGSSLYGVVQNFGYDPFPWGERDLLEYRALPASYGHPNLAGHALVIGIVLWAGLLVDAWQRRRWSVELCALFLPGALMVFHLQATGMRSGVVALAMAGGFVLVYGLRRKTRLPRAEAALSALRRCGGALAGLVLAVVLVAPLLPLDSAILLRLHGYAGAADMIAENPLLGAGPGNYAREAIAHWSDFESLWYGMEGRRNFHAHNEWLHMGAEAGLPGLAALIALFLLSIATFFEHPHLSRERHRALLRAIPVALVAAATDACFGFNLHAPVSAALVFLLLPLRPARPYYAAPTRITARRLALWVLALSVGLAAFAWRDYRFERALQSAKGAVELAQTHPELVKVADGMTHNLNHWRPGELRAWTLRGDYMLSTGRYWDALDAYDEALRLAPELPRLHTQRARVALRLAGEPGMAAGPELELAREHLEKALARCPHLAEAHTLMGWVEYRMALTLGAGEDSDRWRAALNHFHGGRMWGYRDDAATDGAMADLHERIGDVVEAVEAWLRACDGEPGNLTYWAGAVRTAEAAGGASVDTVRQALIHRISTAAEPRVAAALAMDLSALPREAVHGPVLERVFERGLAAEPATLVWWSAWLGLRAPETQGDDLRGRLASFPDSDLSPALIALRDGLQQPNAATIRLAAQSLAASIASPPGEPGAPIHLPLLSVIRQMAGEDPMNLPPEARLALGMVEVETGQWPQAEATLREAEAGLGAEDLKIAHYYRARALLALGRAPVAVALAKAAADGAAPVEHRWLYAQSLAAAGDVDAARFIYEAVLSGLVPDHPYRPYIEGERHALGPAGVAP